MLIRKKRKMRCTAEVVDEVSEECGPRGYTMTREGDETRKSDGDDENRVCHLNIESEESPMSGWAVMRLRRSLIRPPRTVSLV